MKRVNHKLILSALTLSFVLFAYHLKSQDRKYTQTGIASFYADKFEGRKTANGEIYYHIRKTAAHPDLPFGSVVKVTNLENHKFVVVRINDRGPFVQNRIIDLSKSAAQELEFVDKGLAKVKIELIASTNDLPGKNSRNAEKSEYYRIDAQKVSPKGSGIQIGSFSTNENFLRSVERLQTKYNKPVFVEIAEADGQKLFRVIVGRFSTQHEAEKFKKKLLQEFPDCYVVHFKK
ncbi:MAG TPA: septal ring lytic transglycosylase RlpA family protein [Bacteroidales bacterium]|nr:septal ring lytic transglycosylase RlpA family protein [Bacteroidales bacterium]